MWQGAVRVLLQGDDGGDPDGNGDGEGEKGGGLAALFEAQRRRYKSTAKALDWRRCKWVRGDEEEIQRGE